MPGPDPRAKGLKHLGEINNVLSKLGERGLQFIPMSYYFKTRHRFLPKRKTIMSHRFVCILNWKANCENNLKDIPVEGRHVATALENSPKHCSKRGKKVLKKCSNCSKKCLNFRNSARKLLVVFNYFQADVHKYS